MGNDIVVKRKPFAECSSIEELRFNAKNLLDAAKRSKTNVPLISWCDGFLEALVWANNQINEAAQDAIELARDVSKDIGSKKDWEKKACSICERLELSVTQTTR